MATGKRLTEQGEIRFYEWLENKITEAGTAKAFSEKTGLSENNLSTLRRGSRMPTAFIVEKLANAYSLTAADIVGKDGIGDPPRPRGDRTGAKRKPKEEKPEPQPSEEAIPLSYIKEQIERLNAEIEIRRDAIRHYQILMEGWARHAD